VELVVLVVILMLLVYGTRRGGRMPGPVSLILGTVFLLWFLLAFGLGALWNALTGGR